MQFLKRSVSTTRWRLVAALACGLALPASATAAATTSATAPISAAKTPVSALKLPAAATLEDCATSGEQAERSATFVGEMTAVPGTARMAMRIELIEKGSGELTYRPVTYPGLGAWLRSSPGVKTFKNLDKVTDLSAPATYRAMIRFRWMNARNRTIKTLELRTPRCVQPALASPAPAHEGGTGTSSGIGAGSPTPTA
jgi:hypothetical protein